MTEIAKNSVARNQLVRRWLIVFIACGIIWRLVRFALGFPVWGDEAMLALNVVDRSYAELLQPLKYVQVAPVGFLWIVRFTFDHLGTSDYAARIPALIAGIAAVLLFWRWAGLLVSEPAAVLATALIALSGYTVRHGVELKPYAMDLLAAILLLFLATRYLLSQRAVWLGALVAVTPLCSLISFPQIFVAGAIALALLLSAWHADRQQRALVAIYLVMMVGSFLALFTFSARGQYEAAAHGMVPYWHNGFPPANPWRFLLWFIQIHTGNLFAYPLGGKNGASMATVILFGMGVWKTWRKWTTPIRVMLFVPFLLTFMAAVLRLYPYGESARISQHLSPVIMLGAGAGLAVLIDVAPTMETWRKRLNLTGWLLLGLAIIGMSGNVLWPYKTKADAEMRTTVRRLIATASDDPIFLTQPSDEGAPTLFWYLRERPGGVFYGVTPSLDLLNAARSAWVINCAPDRAAMALEIGRQAHMEAVVWSSDDLQIGPKEEPPLHLQIFHFTR